MAIDHRNPPVLDAAKFMAQVSQMSHVFSTSMMPRIDKALDGDGRRWFPLEPRNDVVDLYRPRTPTFSTRIVETDLLTVTEEDWSQVRSPGRARRRMKRGFKQNVRYYQKPDTTVLQTAEGLIMHPETARKLRERLAEQHDDAVLRVLKGEAL